MKKNLLLLFIASLFLSIEAYSITYFSRLNGNWTTTNTWSTVACGGTIAGSLPTASDDVVICAGHAITMSGNPGNCKSLTVNGTINWTTAVTTNVGGGGVTINSGGNIIGTVAGTLVANGDLTVNGTMTSTTVVISIQATNNIFGNGSVGKLSVTTATATNNGTLDVRVNLSGTGSLVQAAGATLNLGGTVSITTLDAAAPGNTVNYNATGPQTIFCASYNNLSVSNSGSKTLSCGTTILGNVNIGTGAALAGSNFSHTVKGDWINNGSFTSGTSTITLDGTITQAIKGISSTSFNNLILSNTSFATICSTNVAVNSALTISAGAILDPDPFAVISGTGTLTGSGKVNITRTIATPDFNSQYTMTSKNLSALTVDYNGAGNQGVNSLSYYHLVLSNSGTKTASGNITVNGNLINNSGVSFDAGIYSHILTGNWENHGTFVSGTSTITFNGTTSINGSSENTFNHISINSAKSLTAPAFANFNVNGNFTNNGGTFNHNSGSVTFAGASGQTLSGSTTFYDLILSKTGSSTVTFSGNTTIQNNFNLTSGNAVVAGIDFSVNDTTTVSSVLDFNNGIGIKTFNTITINPGGAWGNSGNEDITITGNLNSNGTFTSGNGTYTFNGTSPQSVGGNSSIVFNSLTINNSSLSGVAFNTPVDVNGILTLTNGILKTSPGNILTMNNGSSSTSGSVNSFVNGPMRKTGTTAFVFPIGDNNNTKRWRRLGIGASATVTTFRAAYGEQVPSNRSTLDGTLKTVSSIEVWRLDRVSGTGDVPITLYWEQADESGIDDCTNLRIANWDGTKWKNTFEGNSTVSGLCTGSNSGSIATTINATSFGSFTFGSVSNSLNSFNYKYYWVAGAGNWSDFGNHWSKTPNGALDRPFKPRGYDDVYFDTSSFTGPGQLLTVDVNCCMKSINFLSPPNLPVMIGTGSVQVGSNNTPGTAGAITGTSNVCEGQTGVVYSVTTVTNATGYTWKYSGTGLTIASGNNTNSITADFSASATPGELTVLPTNTCGEGGTSPVFSVTVSKILTGVTAFANPNPICEGSLLTLTGGGTGATTWSWTGPNAFSSALQSPTITGISTAGAGVYTLTASNACGSAAPVSTASVTVNTVPTTASAGPNQNPCNVTTTALAGNTPSVGTGVWSVVSGAATITTPSSPTSGVSGLTIGSSATLRWTISNSPCTPSMDDVIINVSALPTTANAGPDQNVCVSSTTLAGNTPAVGTGVWSLISGTGTITDPAFANSGVTGLGAGVNTFRWTISNSPCAASTDDVIITLNSLPPATTANAATGITTNSFTANWNSEPSATEYFLDIATDAGFISFVPGYNNLNVGNMVAYIVTGLTSSTTYYYRVRASNGCGSSFSSNTISATTQ